MSVNGDFGVDRIEGEIMIYRSTSDGQWIPYRSVTKTMYTNFFDVEVTFNCMTYVSYKAAFSATVYKNGVAETITNNLYDTCH